VLSGIRSEPPSTGGERNMTICPIALAVGCRKCPIFAVCPVKGVIGDYRREDDAPQKSAAARPKAKPKRGAKGRR
jgi:hypothetical protein